MRQIVFLNGKFVPQEKAKVSVSTPGFLYGWGLFETMRCRNKKIVYFREHLKRLYHCAGLLGIKCPYPSDRLKEIVYRAAGKSGFRDSQVRITLSKAESGTDILITAKKYLQFPPLKYRKGFRGCVSSFIQDAPSLLANLKTTNYLLYRLALKEAQNKGFDEGIILNHKGHIAEGSRSNLFFVNEGRLFTPSLECGCLDGITRRAAIDFAKKYGIKVYEGNFTIPDLYSCQEAFLTNSLMGIMPLSSLDEKTIGNDKCKKITRFLIKRYNYLLR
ncbi:MAG: aminotransferase class IV [Candidatus Omnitrophica bacterium]|nr:aminotransferase class IV [Candidatus Omnitrophota bacterium]MDD5552434.1 aminotransferase class IV [Candidatus Omnitrophota bacterium]